MRRAPNPSAGLIVWSLALAVATAGCSKIQARIELKQGNAFYQEESYQEALQKFQEGLRIDPGAMFAWRSVGLSALALFRPGDTDAENLRYADTAIDAFQRYLRAFPQDEKVEDYLLTILMSAEKYDQALAHLEAEDRARPGQPEIQRGIITVLTRSGRLEEALARANRATKKDPDVLYTVGVTAWDRAYNDPMLDSNARGKVVDLGLTALRTANQVRPNHFDTMVYLGLLCREKVKLSFDPIEQQDWLAQAEDWRLKAMALREAETAAKPTAGAES